MKAAREEHDGDYLPPHDVAYDLDKQYELRKRKLDENLHHAVQQDRHDPGRAEKRVKIEDGRLPPPPQDSDMTLAQENYPPNWSSLSGPERQELLNAERRRLTGIRMEQAFDCYEQHLFPDLSSAARYFRVPFNILKSQIPEFKRKGQAAPNLREEPPKIEKHSGNATFKSVQLPPMMTNNDIQSENTGQQFSSNPDTLEAWIIEIKMRKRMPPRERQELRYKVREEPVEFREQRAILCYQKDCFNDLNDAAQFFDVPLDKLRRLVQSRKPPAMDEGQEPKQTRQKTESQAPPMPAITSPQETIKPTTTIVEQSQKNTTLAPQVLTGQEECPACCVNNVKGNTSKNDDGHHIHPGPLTWQEELALVEKTWSKAKSGKQPSLAKLRDMAQTRIRKRCGRKATVITYDWVIAFLHRHKCLRRAYRTERLLPPRAQIQVALHGNQTPPQWNEPVLNSANSSGQVATPSTEELPAVKEVPAASPQHHVISQPPETTSERRKSSTDDDPQSKRPPIEPSSQHANQQKPDRDVSSSSIAPTQSHTPTEPALSNLSGSENTAHPLSNPSPVDIETRLRVTYNDDTRIIAINPKSHFPALMERIRQKFRTQHQLRMQLADKDGMITIGDQEDLDVVLADTKKWAMREGMEVVQLQVYVTDT